MLLHFLKLMRWPNLLMIAFTQFSAAIVFGARDVIHFPQLILTILSTILVTCGGYIINDYLDLNIDRINKPQDMIIGKYISRKKGIIFHVTINILALILASFVSPWLTLIDLATILLLIKYSSAFKRQFLTGNILIALLCGAVFPILLCWNHQLYIKPLLSFGFFAAWLTLIREIVKDLEDLKGDRMKNCKTLAITLGPIQTKKVIQWLCAIQLLLIVFYAILLFKEYHFLLPVYLLIFTGIPTIYIMIAAGNLYTTQDYSIMSKRIKFTMLAGITAMWLYLI